MVLELVLFDIDDDDAAAAAADADANGNDADDGGVVSIVWKEFVRQNKLTREVING